MPIDASRVSAVMPISERLWRTSAPSVAARPSLGRWSSVPCAPYLLGSSAPVWYASAKPSV